MATEYFKKSKNIQQDLAALAQDLQQEIKSATKELGELKNALQKEQNKRNAAKKRNNRTLEHAQEMEYYRKNIDQLNTKVTAEKIYVQKIKTTNSQKINQINVLLELYTNEEFSDYPKIINQIIKNNILSNTEKLLTINLDNINLDNIKAEITTAINEKKAKDAQPNFISKKLTSINESISAWYQRKKEEYNTSDPGYGHDDPSTYNGYGSDSKFNSTMSNYENFNSNEKAITADNDDTKSEQEELHDESLIQQQEQIAESKTNKFSILQKFTNTIVSGVQKLFGLDKLNVDFNFAEEYLSFATVEVENTTTQQKEAKVTSATKKPSILQRFNEKMFSPDFDSDEDDELEYRELPDQFEIPESQQNNEDTKAKVTEVTSIVQKATPITKAAPTAPPAHIVAKQKQERDNEKFNRRSKEFIVGEPVIRESIQAKEKQNREKIIQENIKEKGSQQAIRDLFRILTGELSAPTAPPTQIDMTPETKVITPSYSEIIKKEDKEEQNEILSYSDATPDHPLMQKCKN